MQKQKSLFFILLLLIGIPAFSQTYILKAAVKDLPLKKVYLSDYFGNDNTLLDSATADSLGNFKFIMKDSYKAGLYKISMGKDLKSQYYSGGEIYQNILYNKEEIEFSTSFAGDADSIKIINSAENKIYYDFLQKDKKVNVQLEVLSQLPEYFPESDEFYMQIKKRYNELQNQHQKYISYLIKNKPSLLVTHIIKSERFPTLDFSLSGEERMNFIKNHFVDNIDFTDTLLLHTDIFTKKSFAFIKLFINKDLNKTQQEQEYIKAVDTLMRKSMANQKVNLQIKNYLISGFETLELEKVLTHISAYYTSETGCEDDREAKNLKRRVESYKKLAIGNQAPEITFIKDDKSIFKLSELKSTFTLVIFWASWCPHCIATLPEISKLYTKMKEKNLEVLALSIDTDRTEYYKAIEKAGFKWICYSDFKGWDGIASDYSVYATPTMILLDTEKKIIAKPITLNELTVKLEALGIIE